MLKIVLLHELSESFSRRKICTATLKFLFTSLLSLDKEHPFTIPNTSDLNFNIYTHTHGIEARQNSTQFAETVNRRMQI